MKIPSRQRRLLTLTTLAIASLFLVGAASAQAPATGRYRCYEPPSYTVMAWFDLDAKSISVHGDAPQAVHIDTAKGRLDLPRDALPRDALPPYRHGFYFPPGAVGGDAERATIVLASRVDQRPGRSGWDRLPRCYLTTH